MDVVGLRVTNSTPSGEDRQVVSFRTRRPASGGRKPAAQEDLSAYASTPEDPAEYRHRMAVNAAVALVVLALIGVAIWLADTMADMRRNQDCVLSGRRGCTPVEYERTR
jgi:hypothetical protein